MIDDVPLWFWILVIMGVVIVLRVAYTSGDGE